MGGQRKRLGMERQLPRGGGGLPHHTFCLPSGPTRLLDGVTMHTMTLDHPSYTRWTSILLLLVQLTALVVPLSLSHAMGADVDFNLPIAEIEGLIQQLEDAAAQVVGEAGVQLRATVRELAEQMRSTIDELRSAAVDVIREAAGQLRALLIELRRQATALLQEIRTMVQAAINCISENLALRIAQLKDALLTILKQVGEQIRQAVDRLYVRAGQIVDTGTSRILTVANATMIMIAKIALLVIALVILFWLVRAFWKGTFPASKALRYGVPAVAMLLVIGCGYLLVSKSALASILGSRVEIPNATDSCAKGHELHDRFFTLKNQNADAGIVHAVGDSALECLHLCAYTSFSPGVARGLSATIEEIEAVLYPPPAPPPATPVTATCPSVNPGWLSSSDLAKVRVVSRLRMANILSATAVPAVRDTQVYYQAVRRNFTLNTAAVLKLSPSRILGSGPAKFVRP